MHYASSESLVQSSSFGGRGEGVFVFVVVLAATRRCGPNRGSGGGTKGVQRGHLTAKGPSNPSILIYYLVSAWRLYCPFDCRKRYNDNTCDF